MAHVKTVKPHQSKLEDRYTPMVFVGYEEGGKAYRAYNPATKRVQIKRDAVFDESARWNWKDTSHGAPATAGESFTIIYAAYNVQIAQSGREEAEPQTP